MNFNISCRTYVLCHFPFGLLLMFLFALSRLLFKSDVLNSKKYKCLPDEAFLHGLSMMFLSVICYLGIWFVFKR